MRKNVKTLTSFLMISLCIFSSACGAGESNGVEGSNNGSIAGSSSVAPLPPKEIDWQDNVFYTQAKIMSNIPYSIETWLQVDEFATGIIVGNLGGKAEVDGFAYGLQNGSPYMEFNDGSAKRCVFSEVKLGGDEFVHLTLSYDQYANKAYCIVNGEIKQEIDFQVNYFESNWISIIGGDDRTGNIEAFQGVMHSLALYSDARTAEEAMESMEETDVGDADVLAYYDLELKGNDAIVKDETGNGYDLTKGYIWADLEEPEDYDYSFALVGDTQILPRSYPEYMNDLYDYIAETAEDKNVQHVFGLGDITDKHQDREWQASMPAIAKLDGIVPYSLVRGNHDDSPKFNYYVGVSNYASQYKAKYGSGYENTVHEFKVEGLKYLVITLDYGAEDDVLEWANGVVESHPNHNVIVSTHAYLNNGGKLLDGDDYYAPSNCNGNGNSNNGDDMWNEFISLHENIVMVFSGHISSEYVEMNKRIGVNGNEVTEFLIDPQSMDDVAGGMGMVTYFYFSEGGSQVEVQYYSTVNEKYYKHLNHFTFEVNVIK